MTKKIVKKKKLKLVNFLIFLLFLVGLFCGGNYILHIPIKNIIIKNTNYLNDDYIIDLAGIKNYPSFILTSSKAMKNKLLKSSYIKKVTIKKECGFILEIDIDEAKPLFYNVTSNKYVLSNKKEVGEESINSNFRVPRLINYVPDNKYNKFFKGMNSVSSAVLSQISDIEYLPNDYDKDRFLLYMDDGNMVYITLTKFKMINHYNEVLSQLDNHKGILYLDSGNHFKIME